MKQHIQSSLQQPNEHLPKKKQRKYWHYLGYFILFLIVVTISLITFLLTEVGQHQALRLAQVWVKELRIQKVEGSLQKGLVLTEVSFNNKEISTSINQVQVKLVPTCLISRKICLDYLKVDQPIIQVVSSDAPITTESKANTEIPSKIDIPVELFVDQIEINNAEMTVNGQHIKLAQLTSGMSLTNNTGFTLKPTQLNQLIINALPSVESHLNQERVLSSQLDWEKIKAQLSLPLLPQIKTITFPIGIHIEKIQGKEWLYQIVNENNRLKNQDLFQKIVIHNITLSADIEKNNILLNQFTMDSSLADIQGKGEIKLIEEMPLDLSLQADIHDFYYQHTLLLPKTHMSVTASGELSNTIAMNIATLGKIGITVQLQTQLNKPKTPFELTIRSPEITYPFMEQNKKKDNGFNLIKATQIDFKIDGNLFNYQTAGNITLQGNNLPTTHINLNGKGGITYFDLINLQASLLEGDIKLKAQLDWKNQLSLESYLDVSNINTTHYLPDWPAKFTGNAVINGLIKEKFWQIAVPNLKLTGRVSQLPLDITGSFKLDNHNLLNISNFNLNYGKNTIKLVGKLNENSNLSFYVDAPTLRGLLPNFTASLKGHANVTGHYEHPVVDLDLTGEHITFSDITIKKLMAQGKITTENKMAGDLSLNIEQFRYADNVINKGTLKLSGDEQKHKFNLNIKGSPFYGKVEIDGIFDRQQQIWQGNIVQFLVFTPIGQTRISKPISVTYDNKKQKIVASAHCWINPNMELCLPQTLRIGQEGAVFVELKKFNLAMLQPFLDKKDKIMGQVTAQGYATWNKQDSPSINISVTGQNIQVSHQLDYRYFPINLQSITANFNLEHNNASLDSQIQIKNNGKLSTKLYVSDMNQSRLLKGDLVLQQIHLNLLQPLFFKGEKIDGNVNGHLTFGGDLKVPRLNGQIMVNQIQARLHNLPFNITPTSQLLFSFSGNMSALQGHIDSEQNRLDLFGRLAWDTLEDWQSRLMVKANRFRVELPNLAKIEVSPDIEIKADPHVLAIGGKVDIPWGRIDVESLPDSVAQVSEDEVILDAYGRKVNMNQTPQGTVLQSNLKIMIGEDVKIDAYGLRGRLLGQLSVLQNKEHLGLFGQVNIENGRYHSLGQDLLIRKGQISFSGLPSQPFLNIEAIRNPDSIEDNVVAGLTVVGLADSPEVSVFSEPRMSQDQILSYILSGRSLESGGDVSASAVNMALIGFGLSKGGKMIGQLGEIFGIRDLNIDTQGMGENYKVVVSGNITPRLQIKYGVGLFESLAELTLRYRLLPQLYLQSVSGTNQAFDLLYKFEY